MRVLVVEDRRELCDLFARLLAFEGAQAATAGSGREALELASLRPFDAVLCDLGLPDVDGEFVIQQLIAGALLRPAVAVVSGHDEPFLSRARAAGAQAVFRKPVEWSSIVGFLQRLTVPRPDADDRAA
jgi:two-component system CheB/CheR fusion protein